MNPSAAPVRAVLLAALALLAACTRPLAPPPGGMPPPPAPPGPSLVSSLSVETEGDTVVLTLQVTNPQEAPVEVTFPTGQAYDFAVREAGGRELWRWSADRGFTQAVQTRPLAPGATWTFTARWTPPAGVRGALTAVARLASSSHAVEHTSAFRLP